MRGKRIAHGLAFVLVIVALAYACTGCAYVRYRAEDLLEVVDVGLTVTKTPQIGLYWNSLEIITGGYSNVDGWFVGWGGGQIGVTRHYNYCYGLGYAKETVGWGEFDKNDESTLDVRYAGVLGIVLPPYRGRPSYMPACVHFFPHIGYVGLVWNARWMEMADFLVGWTTIDIAGDDGHKLGKWSFPRRRDKPPAPEKPPAPKEAPVSEGRAQLHILP